jgi:hypothetical protein
MWCNRSRRGGKAAVPAEIRTRPLGPVQLLRPAAPGPGPLTGRAWSPLATGLRAVLPGAVGRGGRRQLVRLDDHGGGSGRPAPLSAPPAAPLTQVPCAPRPLREGRSHRPTWCALYPLTPPPLLCPALAPGLAHGGPQGTKYAALRRPSTNAVTFLNALKAKDLDARERSFGSHPPQGAGLQGEVQAVCCLLDGRRDLGWRLV